MHVPCPVSVNVAPLLAVAGTAWYSQLNDIVIHHDPVTVIDHGPVKVIHHDSVTLYDASTEQRQLLHLALWSVPDHRKPIMPCISQDLPYLVERHSLLEGDHRTSHDIVHWYEV